MHLFPKFRLFVAALLSISLLPAVVASPASAVGGAFTCDSTFYQASSGTGFMAYNPATNTFSKVNSGSWTDLNGIGYNPADNYIYGFGGTTLYRVDSAGVQTSLGTVSGVSSSAGDFWGTHGLLEASANGNSWSLVTVGSSSGSSAAFTLTGSTWGAYDLTVVGDMAYGLNNQTLYIVNLNTKVVTTKTVSGSTSNNYGAAYSDRDGNLYFYGNGDGKVFEITPAELGNAIPAAVLMGSAGATYNSAQLSSPNDGANCTSAGSAYAPIVTTTAATSVADTTATINGTISPNNSAISAASFCYGTDSALAGCSTVTINEAYSGWSTSSTDNPSTANLTGLTAGTKYYFRITATNGVGSNTGSILNFTTTGGGGGSLTAQVITFAAPTAVTYGDSPVTFATLGATADSTLTVTYAVSGPCSISGSTVVITGAGDCVITASQAGNGTYAAATDVVQHLTINKKSLSVTASSHSVTVGAAVPTITPAYGAFAYSDTSASLGGTLVCSTTYTNVSSANSYPTSCSGLSSNNYTFNYIAGSVTASNPSGYNYSINYNANGGSGATSGQSGNAASVTVQANGYSRGGWNFQRWNTQPNGSGTNYSQGQTISLAADLTLVLYAIWSPNTYTITYVGNGSTGGVQPGTQYYTLGNPSFGLLGCTFIREGYTCTGWNTSPNGGGANFAPGTQMAPGGNFVMYAQWVKNPEPTPTPTPTPTVTPTPTPTPSASPSATPTPTATPTVKPTPTPTVTPSPTQAPVVKAEVKTVAAAKKVVANQIVPITQAIQVDVNSCSGKFEVSVNGVLTSATVSSGGEIKLTNVLGPKDHVEVRCIAPNGTATTTTITPQPDAVDLANVNFDLASAKLTPAALKILNTVINCIVKHGFTSVTLTGHTDAQGSAGYNNQALSDARAAAVYSYLTKALSKYGVAIMTAGKAAKDPLASNNDKAGQALNRRVEISVF